MERKPSPTSRRCRLRQTLAQRAQMTDLERLRHSAAHRLAIAIMVMLILVSTVQAATIAIDSTADSGAGSLREALASAADGDTIDATGISGTITLASGELVVTNSVTILGPGPGNLAVDGNATSRVFDITNAVTVTISGLTITNGVASASFPYGGGGIHNDHSTLTLSNCILTGNSAIGESGGGIYNDAFHGSATLSIVNCVISGSSAQFGGGIRNEGYSGGSATVTMIDCTVSDNSAGDGGGIFNGGIATLRITSSTFSRNSCTFGSGGGIFSQAYNSGSSVSVQIAKSTLSGNSADAAFGGAILSEGLSGSATLRIASSTLSGNSAGLGGGAIASEAFFGGSATLEIGDTILNSGGSGGTLTNESGTVTSLGYNLISDNGGGLLPAVGDRFNTNPLLDPAGLQDNGGPTPTIALQSNSPAIDKGKRGVIPALASNADQRGLSRPVDDPSIPNATGGDGSDIGAFEVQTIGPGPCPDLTGTWSNLVQTCKTTSAGLQCKVKGKLIVQNIGTADALTSFIRYYLSSDGVETNTFLKQVATGKVKPTKVKKKKLSAKLATGVSGSGQFILAVIDADNTVAECNEDNNVIVFGPLP